jgi:hypothetical protein
MSSGKRANWSPGVWEASFLYKLYRIGARTEPCGTLLVFLEAWITKFNKFTKKCNFDNLYIKPRCHVVSKAFSISQNTAAVDILLLK